MPVSKAGSTPGPQGLYDPAYEHDACGVGAVANTRGVPGHGIVRDALVVLHNLDHRGAAGSEPTSGDGAGIMLQVPDALLRATVDFALPEPRPSSDGGAPGPGVRHRPRVPARRPRRPRQGDLAARAHRRRGGPRRPRLARGPGGPRGRRRRIGGARRDAPLRADRRRHPRPAARRHRARPPRLDRAQARGAPVRRGGVRALHRVALQPHDDLQGHADHRPAAGVLPRPARRTPGQRHRRGAQPVLDQHVPELAAGPPVPGRWRTTARSTRSAATATACAPARRCSPPTSSPATSSARCRCARRTSRTRRASTRCSSCSSSAAGRCRTR